jgi:uncharacterized membrane protein YgcG
MAAPKAEKAPSPDLQEIRDAIGQLPAEQQESLAKWLRQLAAERASEKRVIRERARHNDHRVFFRSPALIWTFISLIAFLVAEGAIFRLGWYNKYLEPQSSAGMVESYLFWLKHTLPTAAPEVMVLGGRLLLPRRRPRGRKQTPLLEFRHGRHKPENLVLRAARCGSDASEIPCDRDRARSLLG